MGDVRAASPVPAIVPSETTASIVGPRLSMSLSLPTMSASAVEISHSVAAAAALQNLSPRTGSTSSASSATSDRKRSMRHRSFLFPAHEILPTNTLITPAAAQLANPRRSLNHAPVYGSSKVQPALASLSEADSSGRSHGRHGHRGRPGRATRKHAGLQFFPLRFRDASLDEIFRKHYNVYVVSKVRFANQLVVFLNAGLLLGQYVTHPLASQSSLFASRVALMLLAVGFYAASYASWFARHFDQLVFVHYVLHGLFLVLPRLLFLAHVWSDNDNDANAQAIAEATLFCSQTSVRMMLLVYFLLVFNASGMRFTTATLCFGCHLVSKIAFVVVFCKECAFFQQLETTVSIAMAAFCMLSAYYSERHVRLEFVERLRVAEERKRREDLLETMLPVHIKENLKQNRTDELAEYYDEVSILFCYVSNFQALAKHASAIELVKLINRIVFCFDKATDARGVYKVEAIAETYMCAAGVPYYDPYHCEKVADMALTMMRIRETEQWTFNGVEIQLQIGIHSGPVVAGVVGSKTYSYHLFGDTVNTSSRICSSCLPGKIQISDRTRHLLLRSGCYSVTDRGMMNLKGKGMVKLYWLDGKRAPPRQEQVDIASALDGAVEECIRSHVIQNSALHHRSDDYIGYMNAVEISHTTLQFQPKKRRTKPTFSSSVVDPSPPMDALDRKGISGTAEEMETVFRADDTRESASQVVNAVRLFAAVTALTIVSQVYNETTTSVEGNVRYGLNAAIFVASMLAHYLIQRFPRHFYKRKELVSVACSALLVTLTDLQLLYSISEASSSGGTSSFSFQLDLSILNAVIFGLAIRLRFLNATLVNAWSFGLYVALRIARGRESWYQRTESFLLYVAVTVLTGHFAYKRELGLRHDFLLKCTLSLEKQKCEDLLANMLPSPQYAEALMRQATVVDELAEVTLLYSDMVGFTSLGATLKPGDICILLNKIYSAFDKHLDSLGIYKMDTVGDAFIVIGGLPDYKSEKHHAAAITAFAIEMLHEIDRFCDDAKVSLQMRIGIHTGKVVGGVVGIKKPRYLIWGHNTVVANLMESRGTPGRIQISDDTYQQLRLCPEFRFEERVGRVQISENEIMRTFYLAKDHVSIKQKVMSRYLQTRPMLNTIALAQLRSCLQLPENSPLSRQLEATRPALNPSRSFVDIIGKRSRGNETLAE